MLSARVWVPLGLLLLTHCSAGNGNTGAGSQTTTAGTSSNGGTKAEPGAGGLSSNAGTPNIVLAGTGGVVSNGNGGSAGTDVDMSGCGDSVLQAAALGEVCDDGNSDSGDGCSADCKAVDQNFSCLTPGEKCVSTVKCGDGKVAGTETCDDGNAKAEDGCDASCQLEMGWLCPTPGDGCVAAMCGDGITPGCDPGRPSTASC